MSLKTIKNPKPKEPLINEENDMFLTFLNKKLRNNRKKLDQISELETRDTLKPEQVEKVKNKQNIIDSNKYFESCKELYYQALQNKKDEEKEQQKTGGEKAKKSAKDDLNKGGEGAIQSPPQNQNQVTQQQQPNQQQTQQQQEIKEQKSSSLQDPKDLETRIMLNVLNLTYFIEFFKEGTHRDEFCDEFNKNKTSYTIENIPDFDILNNLYKRIFTLQGNPTIQIIHDKLRNGLNELRLYLNSSNETLLDSNNNNRKYSELLTTVENVVNSSFFQQKIIEINNPSEGILEVGNVIEVKGTGKVELDKSQQQEQQQQQQEQPQQEQQQQQQEQEREHHLEAHYEESKEPIQAQIAQVHIQGNESETASRQEWQNVEENEDQEGIQESLEDKHEDMMIIGDNSKGNLVGGDSTITPTTTTTTAIRQESNNKNESSYYRKDQGQYQRRYGGGGGDKPFYKRGSGGRYQDNRPRGGDWHSGSGNDWHSGSGGSRGQHYGDRQNDWGGYKGSGYSGRGNGNGGYGSSGGYKPRGGNGYYDTRY